MRRDRTKDETLSREMEAWKLRVSGLTQMQVAEQLGISQPAISKILARIGRRLNGEFIEEVLSVKLQQSAVLETIAGEALKAWEHSKEDAVTEVTVRGQVTGEGDEGQEASAGDAHRGGTVRQPGVALGRDEGARRYPLHLGPGCTPRGGGFRARRKTD